MKVHYISISFIAMTQYNLSQLYLKPTRYSHPAA